MTDSGNLMGVVTTGAGIVIMTGVACHTMKMMDRTMGGTNRNRQTTYRIPSQTRSRSTSSRSSYRRTSSRRR